MIYDAHRVGKKRVGISVSDTIHPFLFTFIGSGINFP